MGKQVVNNLRIGLDVVPRRGPSDDAQLMVVAFADGIGAMFHEKTNEGKAMLLHGEVEGVGVVAFAANVGIGATLEQQLHCCLAVAEDGLVQRCSDALAGALVNELGMGVQESV